MKTKSSTSAGILPGLLAPIFVSVIFLIFFPAASLTGQETVQEVPDAVIVDFFFEPGCGDCARVREEVFPEMAARYEGFYTLNEYDIGIEENYLKLLRYQKKLEVETNASVSIFLDGRYVLNGFGEIESGLFDQMDLMISERLAGNPVTPRPETGDPVKEAESPMLLERVRMFTMTGVVVAGLVDGINPCAISTLVFFISLLSVLKVTGRNLLIVGAAFCFASFVTYTAIGFGLLRALHLFSGFTLLQAAINIFMIVILGVFAFLSFRDAYRFKISGSARDVTLQLPDNVKRKIHRIMRSGLGAGSLLFGSLFIGASVTALESVCTGQVYVPTLVMVIKSGQADSYSYLYLLLYNLMFIVPIVFVFILTMQGLKTNRLIQWSMKNVVLSKVLMGLFFMAMAGLVALL